MTSPIVLETPKFIAPVVQIPSTQSSTMLPTKTVELSTNPFGEFEDDDKIDYDDSKNPFYNDYDESKNPFANDD